MAGKKTRAWREKGKPAKPPESTTQAAMPKGAHDTYACEGCGLIVSELFRDQHTIRCASGPIQAPAKIPLGGPEQPAAGPFKPDPKPEPEGRSYEDARKLERNPRGHNSDERDYSHTEDVWLYVAKPVTDLSRSEMRWGWGIRRYREYPPRLIVWREFVGRDKTWKRAFQDTYKIPMEVYRAILANAPAAEAATAEGAPDPNGDKVPF